MAHQEFDPRAHDRKLDCTSSVQGSKSNLKIALSLCGCERVFVVLLLEFVLAAGTAEVEHIAVESPFQFAQSSLRPFPTSVINVAPDSFKNPVVEKGAR